MKSQLKYLGSLFFAAVIITTACKSDDGVQYDFPDPEPFVDLPAVWELETSLMDGFPEGIEVYRNTSSFKGKTMNAYAVVFDPKSVELEFKPVLAETTTKPSALYAKEEGTKYACINAGFFGANISYSLVQYDKNVQALNIQSLSRPYNDANATYYPTRGAFGLTADSSPEVTWMYHVGSEQTMYSYAVPSPNALNSAPQAQPSETFPEGAKVWNVTSAIGGSPVLLKDGAINITDSEELIAIDNTSSRARSAIGHTADGKVVLLAVEGNNPDGGAGLNLQELAELMKEMGCTAALNLDGGGSTYMMVNGKETVKPSDKEGERAVMSVVFIKKK